MPDALTAQSDGHAADGKSDAVTPHTPAEENKSNIDEDEHRQEKPNHDRTQDKKAKGPAKPPPAGGYDSTPLPNYMPGYTVKFTVHRATNLLAADIHTLSSDPYFTAHLETDIPTRHVEDPPLMRRFPTVRRNINPEWNAEWIVANIPETGFKIKIRIFDEDPADHDDRLGNVTIMQAHVNQHWEGIRNRRYKIKKRMASKRATAIRGCTAMFMSDMHLVGDLFVSIEVLGRTEGEGGRVYTIGPNYWSTHFSPMIGRIAGTKHPEKDGDDGNKTERYKYVLIPHHGESHLPCSPLCLIAFKPINSSFVDQFLPIFTIATSNSSPSSKACSRSLVSAAACST